MKTKKIISIILTVLLIFSFCSFSISAADSGDISISDFSIIGQQTFRVTNEDGTTSNVTENITNELTTQSINSGTFKGYTRFIFPGNDTDNTMLTAVLRLDEDFTISKDHEYNLKFRWGYGVNLPCTCEVYLQFFDNNGVSLKNQPLVTQSKDKPSTVYGVDINFTPSIDFEEGYKCVLRIKFTEIGYNSTNSQSIYVSNTISLVDKDDNTGLINSIIEAIKEIPEKIKGFFTDLANNIKGFFDSLKNYILYFQDPVTLNEDGVLVDENGNPIYVNPFENSIEDIEETFNGWIEDIRSFISGMDESRVQVSEYLQTGTGLINDVLSASPIISAVLIFIASFFVIRKVVGR